MAFDDVSKRCREIIGKYGPIKISEVLGITQGAVSQASTGYRKIPNAWVDRILALEGLEVSISPAKTP